ncbi:thioredoxin domain-containing protein [Halobaculum sp. CBA1158]|uniref:thioredoxin domain-containing protein n=1 Tax=Halobaculum sp. CBA1158 TaxID=2904243 RepID=UPI001F3FB6F2|nr:thioredoxin domain-containing protein [Halobaculum sp. CBA1158]UIO98852.1 thioredoxin domain-containing protein [Halobaculum sp. CBA1158]
MSDPTARNRLDEEASPYLRQHADNPVDWQPWDEEALAAARERDVPIFLSVGYSACHWCHVMEEESFEDEAVAEVLNDEFVPVKVDREERPDLDRVYQTVNRLVNGRGGWPLSVWLTPEGKPFYVGTYFPRDGRQGMPGFLEVCRNLANSWGDPDQRADMESRAEQWTAAARDELESTGEDTASAGVDGGGDAVVGSDVTDGDGSGGDADGDGPSGLPDTALSDAVTAALRSADREHGGFGRQGPKFPQTGRIDLLMEAYARSGREEPLNVAVETLDAMADGGLYDHVGGGFHRYCTDREWVVPHFEKMLYDNAELARVYLDAYRLLGRPRYALVAQETFAFLDRELSHPDGGFYGTLDADSGEGEGEFYVWTPETVADALAAAGIDDGSTVELTCDRFGVTDDGNFEGGTTVLTAGATVDTLADRYDLTVEAVRERVMAARSALFSYRERERERPPRDEKVLAGWNGLAVSALADGARTLDTSLAGRGADALDFVREHLWDDDRLARRYIEREDDAVGDGDVKGVGYLEDYAYLGRGALDLYGVTGDVDHLSFALDLARTIVDAFYDDADGTIYATPEDGEDLVVRPQEPTDDSTPSSLGVATRLLLDVAVFAPDEGFESVARDVLATHADAVRASPLEHVTLALAAARAESGPFELTLACETMPEEWWDTLAGRYLPGVVLAPRPPTEEGLAAWVETLGLSEAPPVWRGREAREGAPTAYACRDRTCSPPDHDLRAALEWAAGE